MYITDTTNHNHKPLNPIDFSDDDAGDHNHHHHDMMIEVVAPTSTSSPHHHPRLAGPTSTMGPKKRAETWVQDETRSLISFRREMDSLFYTSKSNKHLWEQISVKMRERGFDMSSTMCTDKWRNLLKEFKKAKQQYQNNGGNGSAKMSYYKEIEEILRERSRCPSNNSNVIATGAGTAYKNPGHNHNHNGGNVAKIDPFLQFSDKGIDDASIPFGPIEANGRQAPNLEGRLDHEGHPLAITAADALTGGGVPPSFWQETPGNGVGEVLLTMALNFSQHMFFPAHLLEENMVLPIRIANGCRVEGNPEKNIGNFIRQWSSSREVQDKFDYGRENLDLAGSHESVSKDILDLLPADPFGMDISSTVTAITGWLEDLEADYGRYGMAQVGMGKGDYPLFAELNFLSDKTIGFQAFPENTKADDNLLNAYRVGGCSQEGGGHQCCDGARFSSSVEGMGFGNFNGIIEPYENSQKATRVAANTDDGAPHPALSFALAYLCVRDLLSVERVCKSLYSTVQNDPLLWNSIHITDPLSDRINDDLLLQLTSRAQGHLQTLSLVKCQKVTNEGLKRVLDNNRRLIKLSVPGCTKLSINGVLSCLREFKAVAVTGIKSLRIGGLFGVTQEHYEELISLLGVHNHAQTNVRKPHFYRGEKSYISFDDDRPIDLETCPRCQNLRMVYDCPAENCQGKDQSTQLCRGCILCIRRCIECGRCTSDVVYEENFILDRVCSNCSNPSSVCEEGQD